MELHVTPTALAVFVILFVLFLVGLLFYLYPGAGKSSGIPGPDPSDVSEGNISDIRKAGSLQEYLMELHYKYGEVTAFWHGKNLIISVSNMEYFAPRSQILEVPGILFEGWRPLIGGESFIFCEGLQVFQRREQLEFKVDAKAREFYGKVFLKISRELGEKWSSLPEGQHIPLTQHIKGLATKAVCRMLLGDYFTDDAKVIKLHKAWEHCWTYVESPASEEEALSLEKDFKKNLSELKKILEDALEARFKKGKPNEPVLLDGIMGSSTSSASNEKQLLSDAITQLSIGIHVTNSVLLWLMYFIASHPEVQEKLRKEFRKTKGPDIMPETLAKIGYLQQVIKEAVRCGSVFSWTGRKQDIDVNVGGHMVPKNTPVIEAIGIGMEDDDVFSEPEIFDPDRFSEADDETNCNPMDFIPFGFGGSRKAPAGSLVYLLASIVTCCLTRDMKVTLAGNEQENQFDPDYSSFVSKPSKEELWVTVSRVKAKSAESIGKKE